MARSKGKTQGRKLELLDVKAAAFSGAAVGFLAGVSGFAFSGPLGTSLYTYSGFGVASMMSWTIFGGAAGAVVAFIYNMVERLR